MRWPRTPAKLLLSDKTFLVIHENIEPTEGKIPIASRSDGSFETWPPKMRKKRPRKHRGETMYEKNSDEEPRPATAVLEEPLLLDPRLINKLDMSLFCKESLSGSLIRPAALVDNPRGKVEVESDAANGKPRLRIGSPGRSYSRSKPSVESIAVAAGSPLLQLHRHSRHFGFEVRASPDLKKLDDNNNKSKNGPSLQPQQSQLSPLRSQPYRSIVSTSEATVFTGASRLRKASLQEHLSSPEACRSCGRAVQPERLHSHPRSPSGLSSPSREPQPPTLSPPLPPTTLLARASGSIIPVRMSGKQPARKPPGHLPTGQPQQSRFTGGKKSPQSPATATPTPRSEKDGGSDTTAISVISPLKLKSCGEDMRKEKKENSATTPKSGDEKTIIVTGKRRPRTVTCYICGREFGSLSFPIHEPKCLERWERENKALPPSQRRDVPQRPNVPIDSEMWNKIAWDQSQALLIPCSKCKRTFLPDRLAIHERNCRVQNK